MEGGGNNAVPCPLSHFPATAGAVPLCPSHHCSECMTKDEGNMLVLYTVSYSLGTWADASSITILILHLTCTNQSSVHTASRNTDTVVHAHTHTDRLDFFFFCLFFLDNSTKSPLVFLVVPLCTVKSRVEPLLGLPHINNILRNLDVSWCGQTKAGKSFFH